MKTIYIRLIGEGTEVFRPTEAEVLHDDLFKVLPTADYNPDDECWEFVPGSVVRCVSKHFEGDEVLVAVAVNCEKSKCDVPQRNVTRKK